MSLARRDRALMAVVAGTALVLIVRSALAKGGGWPWDWSLFGEAGPDEGGPPPSSKKRKPKPKGAPSSSTPNRDPKDATGKRGPVVIDIYDPDVRLPDGTVVSGETYRRMRERGEVP